MLTRPVSGDPQPTSGVPIPPPVPGDEGAGDAPEEPPSHPSSSTSSPPFLSLSSTSSSATPPQFASTNPHGGVALAAEGAFASLGRGGSGGSVPTESWVPRGGGRNCGSPFPIGAGAVGFARAFFPQATASEWSDWRWQLRARIRSAAEVARIFTLAAEERRAIEGGLGQLPVGITPYYASLLARDDPGDPLRRTCIPVDGEFLVGPGEAVDPLGEDRHMPVPGLVHRYPDRVLFLTTGFCSTYCRYCTRSRMVGHGGEQRFDIGQWERALAYIAGHAEIRDVLLSGGDPLTLGDDRLDWLLGRLREIPHVEFVRIGSKVPAVLPMRIDRPLIRVLRRHKPWLSLHFTHPAELTPETAEACNRLADAGLPLGSQTVLLAGVNDEVATLKALFHGLLRLRVRPYYLYQCDPIVGSAHFRTSVARGIEMIRGLRGHTSGYAVPTYVIDAPGGGGKIPLLPDYLAGREGDDLLLTNFEGGTFRYPGAALAATGKDGEEGAAGGAVPGVLERAA